MKILLQKSCKWHRELSFRAINKYKALIVSLNIRYYEIVVEFKK